jgi:hypothetical protein
MCGPESWPWQAWRVRHSDFWRLMEDEFGKGYARSVASDQVISALDQRTPVQALDAGVPPRQVWTAVCEAMNVPPERRLGLDPGERRKRGTQRGDR